MTRLDVGSFRVDLDSLDSCVWALGRTEGELETLASDLTAQLGRLHEDWRGDAALAHTEAQRHWSTAFHQLQEALTSLRTAAGHAHTSYDTAARANQAMWSQLR